MLRPISFTSETKQLDWGRRPKHKRAAQHLRQLKRSPLLETIRLLGRKALSQQGMGTASNIRNPSQKRKPALNRKKRLVHEIWRNPAFVISSSVLESNHHNSQKWHFWAM